MLRANTIHDIALQQFPSKVGGKDSFGKSINTKSFVTVVEEEEESAEHIHSMKFLNKLSKNFIALEKVKQK